MKTIILFLAVLLALGFVNTVCAKNRLTILIIIPRLQPLPVFDLIDPETSQERDMTQEEEDQLDEYEHLQENFDDLETEINKWVINGVYEQVISQNGISLINNDEEYQAYFIDGARLVIDDIEHEIETESTRLIEKGIDTVLVLTDVPRQWLEENNYTYPISYPI